MRARKQPLSAVAYRIAMAVGVPFEMVNQSGEPQRETSELVDVNFSNYTLEQAVQSLSPAVRLYVRTDLQSLETKPLRILLGPPAKN